jgi:hypothetical protein
MSHPQFEAVKVALKQDRTGYILTLNIHPEDLDERILRDFVGARYQVVMVRLNDEERPMNREAELGIDPVKLAGILSRDKDFHAYLVDTGNIFEATEKDATEWIRDYLKVKSRTEIRDKPEAVHKLKQINEEFKLWKRND